MYPDDASKHANYGKRRVTSAPQAATRLPLRRNPFALVGIAACCLFLLQVLPSTAAAMDPRSSLRSPSACATRHRGS